MNSYCQFQRGFFVMRQCDRLAVKACKQCGRQACQQHLSTGSGMTSCVDCAEGQNQRSSNNYQDDDWLYSYRRSYYGSGYQPFMYHHQDYRSFDRSNETDTDNFDDDNYAGGDFSDS